MVHELSKADARRICVQAQLLDAPRPGDVLEVVRHLTVLQTEPTAPLGAPSADLVLWSRLGSAYDRAELVDLVDRQVLIDHQGFFRPSEDIALFRAEMSIWPGREPLQGVAARQRRVGRDQRRLPARDPRRAAPGGAAADQRVRGHLRGAVAVLGLEQQQATSRCCSS